MLDKNERKRLTKEYAAVSKRIGRVLKRFTPIDPADEFSMGDDYERALPNIVSILFRGGNREELVVVLRRTRSECNAPPNDEKDFEIADAVLKSSKSKTRQPKAKPCFKLDLRDDAIAISDFIRHRVNNFALHRNPGPGASSEITSITIGFECCQAGWLSLVFDLRIDSTPDGEWTLSLGKKNVCIKRKDWFKASTANMRGPIEIVHLNGTCHEYAEEKAPLPDAIGDMVKDTVLTFRNNRGFSGLPSAFDCRIYIENFDGYYNWPDADKSGGANLAIPTTIGDNPDDARESPS